MKIQEFRDLIKAAEPAPGIEYFFRNYEQTDKEITLYCALRIVDWMEEDALWVTVYEYGLGKKIKPRDSLVRRYQEIKQEQKKQQQKK